MMSHAATFAAVLVTLLVAHQVADHWVQTSHQAAHKAERTISGSLACVRHVMSYTIVTAVLLSVAIVALRLQVTAAGFVVGQLVSAVTHYWADRRFTLEGLARLTRQIGFYRLGAPRDGRDDNPTLGTGAYALDQSWHWAWLWVAALVTTLI